MGKVLTAVKQSILSKEKGTKMTEQSTLPALATFKHLQNVDHMKKVIAANIGSGVSSMTPFDLDRIRVPSGNSLTWEIPSLEGTKPEREFEGIIVGWTEGRSYWSTRFSPGQSSPPDCYSDDLITGIGEPGGPCKTCPWAQWGSAIGPDGQQAKGQACRTVRLLFTMLRNNALPVVVSIPPSSLGEVKSYFMRLASQGFFFNSVVTKFSLMKGEICSLINFVPTLFLSAEEHQQVQDFATSIQPLMATVRVEAADVSAG